MGPDLFMKKKLSHHESLVSKNDCKLLWLLVCLDRIFLVISIISYCYIVILLHNFSRIPRFDKMTGARPDITQLAYMQEYIQI